MIFRQKLDIAPLDRRAFTKDTGKYNDEKDRV